MVEEREAVGREVEGRLGKAWVREGGEWEAGKGEGMEIWQGMGERGQGMTGSEGRGREDRRQGGRSRGWYFRGASNRTGNVHGRGWDNDDLGVKIKILYKFAPTFEIVGRNPSAQHDLPDG